MKILQKLANSTRELPILKNIKVQNNSAFATDLDMRITKQTDFDDGFYREGYAIPVSDNEASNFPDVSRMFSENPVKTYTFNLDKFLKDLQFLSPSMSKEETRCYICGIVLHENNMIATNGHTLKMIDLYSYNVQFNNPEYQQGSIIPSKAIKFLIEILKAEKKTRNTITMTLCQRGVSFSVGSYLLETKLIDGTYPEYKRVIPKIDDKYKEFLWNQTEAKAIFKQVKAYNKAHDIKEPIVRLENNRAIVNNLVIDTLIDCPITCGFNAAYLADIPDGNAYILDESSPMLVKSANKTSVIMLVKIK